MSDYTVFVAARITPEMKKELDEIAKRQYAGISAIIRRAIAHYIEKEKA
jgi:predicted transcriptional regulator